MPERGDLTPAQTRDVHYDYDLRGLQTRARFDHVNGEGVTAWYDGFGRPVTTLLAMGGHSRYLEHGYDRSGNRTGLTFAHPEYVQFGFAYDGLGRMIQAHEHRPAPSVDDLIVRYWYNPLGSRHAVVRGAGSGGFYTIWYRDPLERPTVIANDLPFAGADMVVELAYNPASQIVSRSVSNDAYAAPSAANVVRGYEVNGLNQYTGTTWGGAPNWGFEYDPNGNLKRTIDPVGTGTTDYLYDVENRLVAASGASNATLVYDPLGRLFEVTSANGSKTQFLHDGDDLVAEYDGAGNLTRRYVHGPSTDDPVAVYDGPARGHANRRYTMPDERGSIAALVNADGSPWWVNRYDSWGVPGDNRGRFQYTGQAWIGELGLYYYKARFYSPGLGRFMQVDPIGYEDQINLYVYVGNDPLNNTDPDGKAGRVVLGAIGGMAFEVTLQTVVQGKSWRDIDLGDVAIAGVQGVLGQGLLSNATKLYKHYNMAKQVTRAASQAQNRAHRASSGSSLRKARNAAYHADRRAAHANKVYRQLRTTGDVAAGALIITEGAKRATQPVTIRNPEEHR